MEIKIRKATIKDLETVRALNRMLFENEIKSYDSTLNLEWSHSKESKKYFSEIIKTGFAAVAEADGKVVGYLTGESCKTSSFRKKSRMAEIDNMFVLDKCRGKGIGALLVRAFLDWCKLNRAGHVRVIVSAKNMRGIDFYRKQGFKDYDVTLEIDPENTKL
jgi:GNAT superfamily N-acetyltransferase